MVKISLSQVDYLVVLKSSLVAANILRCQKKKKRIYTHLKKTKAHRYTLDSRKKGNNLRKTKIESFYINNQRVLWRKMQLKQSIKTKLLTRP